MIRFILPVLLLLVASCQVPQNSDGRADASAASATTVSAEGSCCESEAGATATAASQAVDHEGCVMAGTGTCEEGECPMQAACDAGVSACADGAGCDMKAKAEATAVSAEGGCCSEQADNATATKALLVQASSLCEGCSDTAMCSDCTDGIAAAIAACPGCEEGEFCSPCLDTYQTAVKAALEGGSCCDTEAAATATAASQAVDHEGCVMAGTGTCEEGECPMQAACDAGVSACADGGGCDMKAAKLDNATATKAVLIEATADCEGCSADKMCTDCDTAVKAMWAACEGCTDGAFCTDCLTNIKKAMAGECDGGSCESSEQASCESTEAAGATKASQETPAKSCCDTPQG